MSTDNLNADDKVRLTAMLVVHYEVRRGDYDAGRLLTDEEIKESDQMECDEGAHTPVDVFGWRDGEDPESYSIAIALDPA